MIQSSGHAGDWALVVGIVMRHAVFAAAVPATGPRVRRHQRSNGRGHQRNQTGERTGTELNALRRYCGRRAGRGCLRQLDAPGGSGLGAESRYRGEHDRGGPSVIRERPVV